MLKYIVVIIPKFNFYKVIFEKDFFISDLGRKNEYYTQNLIIESLETLGLKLNEDFTCDLCSEKQDEKQED